MEGKSADADAAAAAAASSSLAAPNLAEDEQKQARSAGARGRRGTVCAMPVKVDLSWKPNVFEKVESEKKRLKRWVSRSRAELVPIVRARRSVAMDVCAQAFAVVEFPGSALLCDATRRLSYKAEPENSTTAGAHESTNIFINSPLTPNSVLRDEILFQHLEERDMDLVIDAMELKTFEHGEIVIKQ